MTLVDRTPLKIARRIKRRSELPQVRNLSAYKVENDDTEPETVTVGYGMRQFLEALKIGRLYAAAPVRISHYAHLIRTEKPIQTEAARFPNDPETGAGSFGICRLLSRVNPIEGGQS